MSSTKPAPAMASSPAFVLEIDPLDDVENDAVASHWIERGLKLAIQDFRSHCGLKRAGEIVDAGRKLGRWKYFGVRTTSGTATKDG